MNYEMRVQKKYASSKIIADPSPEQIDYAIDNMLPMLDEFVVFVCKKKTNYDWYIQTIMDFYTDNAENVYRVDTRFVYKYNADGGHDDFRHYRLTTTDVELVKQLFRMYALGEMPDVSEWEDITSKLFGK